MSTAIAVWASPDGQTVTGTIRVGVVAYHETGILRVDFDVDGGATTSVYSETKNPDHDEYEFVHTIDTSGLANGTRVVNAVAYPVSGTAKTLPAFNIQVANGLSFNTYYVSPTGHDDTGDGSSGNPWLTIEHALDSCTHGDTILCQTGTYDYPSGAHTYTKYVTIKEAPGQTATISVNSTPSNASYIRWEGLAFSLAFGGSVNQANANHVMFLDCTFSTASTDWVYTDWNTIPFYFGGTCHHIYVDGCEYTYGYRGACFPCDGDLIFRHNSGSYIASEGVVVGKQNILLTRNTWRHLGTENRPVAWSVAKNAGPYSCGGGITLSFYHSINGGSSYTLRSTVELSGTLTAAQVVAALNADDDFNDYFIAEISASPYPDIGNVLIKDNTNTESRYWYVTGDTGPVFDFSDNTSSLHDISVTYPAKNGGAHSDYISFTGGDLDNVIYRQNDGSNSTSLGIKFGRYPAAAQTKSNVAIYSNVIHTIASWAIYNNIYNGYAYAFNHFVIEFNDFWNTGGAVNAVTFFVSAADTENPSQADATYTDWVFRNNILGIYQITNYSGVPWYMEQDYNVHHQGTATGGHSVVGDPLFVTETDGGDLHLQGGSPAIAMGLATNKPPDLDNKPRSVVVDAGAYLYTDVGSQKVLVRK